MIGFLIAIFLLLFGIQWLRETFPRSTHAAGTVAKGAWAVTKGAARLTHRGVVAGAELYASTRDEVTCPHCKTTFPTIGVQECRSCGRRVRKRFYAPCKCGCRLDHLRCPSCGLHCDAPLLWLRPQNHAPHTGSTSNHGHRRRP